MKFKASLEKNEVPIEVLLRCPSIIDAASEEEVSEYLAPFKAAMDFQISGDIIETDIVGESDDDIDSEVE